MSEVVILSICAEGVVVLEISKVQNCVTGEARLDTLLSCHVA